MRAFKSSMLDNWFSSLSRSSFTSMCKRNYACLSICLFAVKHQLLFNLFTLKTIRQKQLWLSVSKKITLHKVQKLCKANETSKVTSLKVHSAKCWCSVIGLIMQIKTYFSNIFESPPIIDDFKIGTTEH